MLWRISGKFGEKLEDTKIYIYIYILVSSGFLFFVFWCPPVFRVHVFTGLGLFVSVLLLWVSLGVSRCLERTVGKNYGIFPPKTLF